LRGDQRIIPNWRSGARRFLFLDGRADHQPKQYFAGSIVLPSDIVLAVAIEIGSAMDMPVQRRRHDAIATLILQIPSRHLASDTVVLKSIAKTVAVKIVDFALPNVGAGHRRITAAEYLPCHHHPDFQQPSRPNPATGRTWWLRRP